MAKVWRSAHFEDRKPRRRLYPRAASVLQQIDAGAMLIMSPEDGRYRIDGKAGRDNTVILRTVHKLLRLGSVRPVSPNDCTLRITKAGRLLLRRWVEAQAAHYDAGGADRCNGRSSLEAGQP